MTPLDLDFSSGMLLDYYIIEKKEVERKDKERAEWDAFCNRKVKVG